MNKEVSCNPERSAWKEHKFSTVPPLYLGVGVLLFILGAILASAFDSYLPPSMSNTKKAFEGGLVSGRTAGFAEAKAKFESSSAGKGTMPVVNTRNLSGKVTKVAGDSITVRLYTNDPFADPSLLNRTILLTASTTVNLISEKVEENKNAKRGDVILSPITEVKKVTGAEIKLDDNLGIYLSKESVNSETPTAVSIQILPRTLVGRVTQ